MKRFTSIVLAFVALVAVSADAAVAQTKAKKSTTSLSPAQICTPYCDRRVREGVISIRSLGTCLSDCQTSVARRRGQ